MEKIKPLDLGETLTATYVVADQELMTIYEKSLTSTSTSTPTNTRNSYINHKQKSDSTSKSFTKTYYTYSKAMAEARREEWYHLICSEHFNPIFSNEQGVRFFNSYEEVDSHNFPYRIIEELVSNFIFRATETSTKKEEIDSITQSMLLACSQLLRYLPEFEKRQPHYFIDSHSSKLGVAFQKHGTLTILIGESSEIEYSYAQKQKIGTVRISGTAKLTKNLYNSKFIRKLLRLQGLQE